MYLKSARVTAMNAQVMFSHPKPLYAELKEMVDAILQSTAVAMTPTAPPIRSKITAWCAEALLVFAMSQRNVLVPLVVALQIPTHPPPLCAMLRVARVM